MRSHRLAPLVLLAACTTTTAGTGLMLGESDQAYCVALGADYHDNVGTMAAVALPSLKVTRGLLPGTVSGDPVLRALDGHLFIVNRGRNNVTVVNSATWAVEHQFSTGPGSNPQDVAVAGSKAYIAAYGTGSLQVWNLDHPALVPETTIDLSSYDPDGAPNANSIVVSGDRAYVTLDLLDTAAVPRPRGKGKIVVIDTRTDRVVDAFDLTYTNPYGFMAPRGDGLVVATLADFSGAEGCVEQVTVGASPGVGPCLVENKDLGGTVSAIAVGADGVYLAVSTFDSMFNQTASLRRLGGDGKLGAALTPADQVPTDLALAPTGHLVYADQMGGGLRVYDLRAGKELTSKALDIGLTPAAANAIVCLPR